MPFDHTIPIIDGHNDTVLDLYNNGKGQPPLLLRGERVSAISICRGRARAAWAAASSRSYTPASAGVADPADTSQTPRPRPLRAWLRSDHAVALDLHDGHGRLSLSVGARIRR